MPTFSDSFWTPDYATGMATLFRKLHQGCVENDEYIRLFQSRSAIEGAYGNQLHTIPANHAPLKTGFGRDDGASVKQSFLGIQAEIGHEGAYHQQVSENINVMILEPFGRWCDDHKKRVAYSEEVVQDAVRSFLRTRAEVDRLEKKYFNKCRVLEDLRSSVPEDEELSIEEVSQLAEDSDPEEETYELGGVTYTEASLRPVLASLLSEVPQFTHKVTLLGNYERCSTGSAIALFLQGTLQLLLDDTEQFGQDLVDQGFLRLVGQVSSSFVNSKKFIYQWKDRAFAVAHVPYKKAGTSYFDEVKENLTNMTLNKRASMSGLSEKQAMKKLVREVDELDREYLFEVKQADNVRCELEELIVDHMKFMEKCEMDRLKAVKKVTLDFLSIVSNKIASLKSVVDRFMIYEETISPQSDLNVFLQTYKTGSFKPKPVIYDNYYSLTSSFQIFGIDIESRCRAEGKLVPLVVSSCLQHMDAVYPDLTDDQARIDVWIVPTKLATTHQLRAKLNEACGKSDVQATASDYMEIMTQSDPSVVASVLKLYLLELPDSLVSSQTYELFKSLYSVAEEEVPTDEERINGVTNLLVDLPKAHIATLNALLTHFSRLIGIIESKNLELAALFTSQFVAEFGELVLRPKVQTGVNMDDKFVARLLRDLLEHMEAVFKSLKRLNSTKKRGKSENKNVPSTEASISSKLQRAVEKGKRLAPDGKVAREREHTATPPPVSKGGEEDPIVVE
ncbi:hypothetical protein BABINDRAFT_161997 [Babjeviella inositovora NRRL Y-12698]|uniref:Rho-GAP domain-containing protein n=1 Tax=Babjeviella inositovora NRRL Y-12698 TaxID=984486 RepID=A0A1E3QQ71_9ASCO|nr:uncharacterized protein BABINDRAFT_161997 [Babjeviella inositovora NRRL Y-12698]ODQ79614.1 hypothetical protein BABINDRAFT_161997 [Babjeviella inositovora NRRL Y-12698]